MSKKVKIFILLILAVAIVIAISTLAGKPSETGGLSSTQDIMPLTKTVSPQGNEFSSLLSTVTSINIDESIFSSPAYKALRDNPVTLGTDTVGRSNPFAPIGNDAPIDTARPSVQTLQPGKVTGTTAEFAAQVTFTTTAPVSVVFQYGTTDQFGTVTTPLILNKSGTAVATAKNLLPNTTYYVQAVAVVGSTTTTGNTMSFTTAPTNP